MPSRACYGQQSAKNSGLDMPPLKYFVPNTFTAISLLLGLASVTMSAQGSFELAAWMILWGTLLDKLDGSAARLFNATSDFGVEFDSFADFVAFGIAPAALVYYRLLKTGQYEGGLRYALMLVTGLYAVALAVRLARFNITTGGESVFYGMPGTLMGAIGASGYLVWSKYQLLFGQDVLKYLPLYLIVAAVLMLSNVRLPKLKVRKNKLMNVFQFGNIAAVYICGPLRLAPEYLFSLGMVYVVGGVSWSLTQADEPSPAAAAAKDSADSASN